VVNGHLPCSPFAGEAPVPPAGPGPQGNPGAPAVLGGSGRRSGNLPPRPTSSSSGKGMGHGRPLSGLSTELRSESWGSFTSAGAPAQDWPEALNWSHGHRSADLESWGSFRQPSEDGGAPSESSESPRALGPHPESCCAVVQVGSGAGKAGGGGPWGRELGPQWEGGGTAGVKAVPAMLSASEMSLVEATRGSGAVQPPRHDSALELDLLSRFIQEAVEQRKS
jgi:hypothetical protein